MSRTRDAFTLVELSIVLVILGLLVGGVLAGQSLIHAAELRAVNNEFTNFKTALGAFREKYFAVPGDMSNAVKFWGAAAGGTSDGVDGTCSVLTSSSPSTGTETCNGDGNGGIGDGGAGNYHEWFRAWQHLANAGLIEGNYTGVPGAAGTFDSVGKQNVPGSRYPSAIWGIRDFSSYTAGDSDTFPGRYHNVIFFGAYTSNDLAWNPVLKAEDAYNIDVKTDDGKPNTGNILAMKNSYRPDCVAGGDTDYDLSNANTGCNLLMISGY